MWKLPVLEARAEARGPSHSNDTDLIVAYQDVGKKAVPPRGTGLQGYAQLVDRFRKGDAFTAKGGANLFVRFGGKPPADHVLFVGVGPAAELTAEKLRVAGGNAWSKLSAERVQSVAVRLDSFFGGKEQKSGLSHAEVVRAFAEGLILGAYRFTRHKSSGAKSVGNGEDYAGPARLTFVTSDKGLLAQVQKELPLVAAVGESVNVTRDWSNEPSNFGTPEYYAAEAQKLARAHGLKCRILTEKDAAREKMGLFLAVGQGSEREGRIAVVEYAPKSAKGAKTLALVGKGVTFDSGGISIKPSLRMEDMRHDMTGAATVMGAVLLAARWKVPNRIIGIMAFTENMPDGGAVQPGNVIRSRAGKTVEIINTDAEGRLVLADVLDYAHDFKPDAIVNIATLTGAVSIALGKHCCAIMGNDEGLVESLRRSGDASGERIWELPLFEEYFEDLRSDTADMKNSANDGSGGTIRGGIFLKQFIRKGMRWAHLDIAAMAYGMAHVAYFPKKGASGYFVRTLARFAAEF